MSADPTMAARQKRIRALLKASARPENLARMLRAIPNTKMLGVRVPEIRMLAAKCAKDDPLTFHATLQLFDALCAEQLREEILLGVFLLARHKKHLREIQWSAIDGWLDHIDNWETCDQLASNVVAAAVAGNAELRAPLRGLTGSTNPWRKRFAVSTAAALNQHGRFLPELTLMICQDLLAEGNPAIRKAVGWALRELSKKDEDIAFDFLWEHRENMQRSLLREASEKLTAARRSRLLV